MEENVLENNQTEIAGVVSGKFEFSHETHGEKMYLFIVESKRESGFTDRIPVMISERLIDVSKDYNGKFVEISGQFRSRSLRENEKRRLLLWVFAKKIEFLDENIIKNKVMLKGIICREPVYRETPLGREITDLMLVVNRTCNNYDYIPCICWGRCAKFIGAMDVGTEISLNGRIQSRTYTKKLEDGTEETRTVYEVSASYIESKTN